MVNFVETLFIDRNPSISMNQTEWCLPSINFACWVGIFSSYSNLFYLRWEVALTKQWKIFLKHHVLIAVGQKNCYISNLCDVFFFGLSTVRSDWLSWQAPAKPIPEKQKQHVVKTVIERKLNTGPNVLCCEGTFTILSTAEHMEPV